MTIGLCLVIASACKGQSDLSPSQRGERTFMRNCASCHGADGKGLPIPGYQVPPADLTTAQFQSTHDDAAIRSILMNGKGAMPPLGKLLPPSELDELIMYVRSLGR